MNAQIYLKRVFLPELHFVTEVVKGFENNNYAVVWIISFNA